MPKKTTLAFFPKSAYLALSGMSEKALIFLSEPVAHRMLVISEASGLNSAYFDSGQISASLTSPGTFGDYQEVLGRERLMQVTLRYEF
ncbi:MAG: hypothetical protein IH793_11535 [Acidobacteria bacterium]|nr:hypothetical protein [Acidobacteriota bacterium]